MRFLFLLLPLFLAGCQTLSVPPAFYRTDYSALGYTLASWQKDTGSGNLVRIYLEGDGHAFHHDGRVTSDPTPRGTFLRQIAFADPNPNVVYLARPCQFVMSARCTKKDWSTARFSEPIVSAVEETVTRIAAGREVVLIGYSGGALLSGLVIERGRVKVRRWVTLAGLLNHEKWTRTQRLTPLTESINLTKLPAVEQVHYYGAEDPVLPASLFVGVPGAKEVPGAGHDRGFESVLSDVYDNDCR